MKDTSIHRSANTPNLPCDHTPICPAADDPDHDAARVISAHPEQGWSLLCNHVIVFDDTGELLPNRASVAPHRPVYHEPLSCGCEKNSVCATHTAEVLAQVVAVRPLVTEVPA